MALTSKQLKAAREAISRCVEIAGTQEKLAKNINDELDKVRKENGAAEDHTTQRAISHWMHNSDSGMTAEYVLPCVRAVGGQVREWELRPDIYPPPK